MLSWFDLLLCTIIHAYTRDYCRKGKGLKHDCRCTAGAVLLYTCFVTAHTPLTHTWCIQQRSNLHIHTGAPPVAVAKSVQRGCCCSVTATSPEPGGGHVCCTKTAAEREETQTYCLDGSCAARRNEAAAAWGPCSVGLDRCDCLPSVRGTQQTTRGIVATVGANLQRKWAERGRFVGRGVLHVQCEVHNIIHRARCNRYA